ncbi:MAG: hypothetical protein M1818_006414 [Claussenomyces sp. TS43310]|nr:MAG: hypothetical protein M1818_006414 [Claussenomyces sp. TS43310]
MAEVIGLVASGISIGTLVAQIGSSILKLRNYWSEVGNAPETISSMLEEIEVLHSISANIEDDQARNLTSAPVLDSALAKRCLTQCQKAADRLEDSLHQLQHEAMLARLSQLVISSDTSLANRSLSIAVTEDGLYPKGGRKVQAESQTPKQPFAYSLSRYLFGFISYQKSRLSITSSANSGKQQDTTGKEELVQVTAVARAPGWLVRRAWEIQAVRTRNVWNINILSYNVISEQSAVFEYTRLNNVEGVKALFSERRASPFDRDVHGQTLLHQTMATYQHAVFYYLRVLKDMLPMVTQCDDEEATEAARLFLPDADIDEDYIVLYRGDEKGFTLLLQHTIQPYYKWDTVARESIAHNLIYHPLGITPIVFKKAFFQDIISPKSSKTLVSGNSVAIHGIATVIGHNYAALRNFRVQEKYVSEEHLRGRYRPFWSLEHANKE